ncbi:MAG: sugar ABC transporter ATP-binding protein [Lachnospiraceae bacterium]|nr:sugar ABC transporter ATP-binding protein [Lachnospiraceae bacterium]
MELLKMEQIQKAFFGVKVLEDVSLVVEEGEVHALLGENGAGKSTLMNILSGVYTRDAGTVVFAGKELQNGSIAAAEQAGIAFVHQELNIFNDLKVYENLFLGKEYVNRFGRLDKNRMRKEAEELLMEMGVQMDPEQSADELDTGKKQLLEIAKALHSKAKLIILDEPTTALNKEEIVHLFELIRNLKEKGTTFIFISHKMPEIFQIADRYTVLRNARFIHSGKISETNAEQVTRYMVGETYSNEDLYKNRELGETVLEVKEICGKDFDRVSFELKKGEILGFTGLQGAGCSEVMQALFGYLPITSGTVTFRDQTLPGGIHQAMKHKVGMVAANRKENSVVADMTLLENMYLSEHTISGRKLHIYKQQEQKKYENYHSMLNIKANSSQDLITSLSGGNQQKVILARWLNTNAELLLLDNPTQGIDVGAKEEIYRLILELAQKGITIIVNTLEIPELKKIADRCIVFYHGRIMAQLPHDDLNEEAVMLYATGAVDGQKNKTEGAYV